MTMTHASLFSGIAIVTQAALQLFETINEYEKL